MPFIPEDERRILRGTTSLRRAALKITSTPTRSARQTPGYAVTGKPVPFYSQLISSAIFPGDIQRGHPAGAFSRRPLLLYQPACRLLLPESNFHWLYRLERAKSSV